MLKDEPRGAARKLVLPLARALTTESTIRSPDEMLVVQTPGGLYERFFEEVGAPSDGGSASLAEEDRLDLETIVDIGAECGIEMAPPAARSSVTWVG